jgi:hypothetical protein
VSFNGSAGNKKREELIKSFALQGKQTSRRLGTRRKS